MRPKKYFSLSVVAWVVFLKLLSLVGFIKEVRIFFHFLSYFAWELKIVFPFYLGPNV